MLLQTIHQSTEYEINVLSMISYNALISASIILQTGATLSQKGQLLWCIKKQLLECVKLEETKVFLGVVP